LQQIALMLTIKEIENLPVHFIMAMGRSGTTLLQTMLDAHENIVAPFESRFLLHFKNKYQKTNHWTEKTKNTFFEDVTNEQKISLFWDLNKSVLKNYLNILPQNASYTTACKMVYLSNNSIFKKGKPLCIIDKNPVYSWLIPLVLNLFPDANFIHLIRDARGCVNSFLKFRKGIEKKSAQSWNTANYYIESFKKERTELFFTLRYEDLLKDPTTYLSDLCHFLNLDFQKQMCTYYKEVNASIETYLNASTDRETLRLRKKGFELIHNNISKPINPSRIDSWKNKLSPKQIDTISNASAYYLSKYGYLENTNISKNKSYSYIELFTFYKIQLYYCMPIWLRELKSKPSLALLEDEQ